MTRCGMLHGPARISGAIRYRSVGRACGLALAGLLGIAATALGQQAGPAGAPPSPPAPAGQEAATPPSPPAAPADAQATEAQSKSRISDVPIPLKLRGFPARPKPLLELGSHYLGTGPIHGLTSPTGEAWTPSFILFGTMRSSGGSSTNYSTTSKKVRTDQWANRLDLFGVLSLTFTERFVFGLRPLDETDPTGARLFAGYTRTVGPTGTTGAYTKHYNFNWNTVSHLFFEGDFGELFPGLDTADRRGLDYGFAVGRQPISFQEGLLINDTLDAVGITRNNLKIGKLISTRITTLFAWNQINRNTPGKGVLSNRVSDGARLIGVFTEADSRAMTTAIDVVYVGGGRFTGTTGATARAGNGLYAGVSFVGRPGGGLSNLALRFLTSQPVGTRSEATAVGLPDPASRGALIMSEYSWTPHRSQNLFYANAFAAVQDYRAAALDPLVPGPLARVGVLFEGSGIGNGAPLSPTASRAVGGAFGHQRFFSDTRQQVILEVAGRYATLACPSATATCDPHQIGAALRYQLAIGRRFIVILDGSVVDESLRGITAMQFGKTSRIRQGLRFEWLTQF